MSTSNGDGSHDCAPVMWAYGIPCPAMVSPNVSQHKEDKLLYPDHYLVWYAKVDSGPHSLDGVVFCLKLRVLTQSRDADTLVKIYIQGSISMDPICSKMSSLYLGMKKKILERK